MKRYKIFFMCSTLEKICKVGVDGLVPVAGGLPDDARIIGAEMHPSQQAVALTVESRDYPVAIGIICILPDPPGQMDFIKTPNPDQPQPQGP